MAYGGDPLFRTRLPITIVAFLLIFVFSLATLIVVSKEYKNRSTDTSPSTISDATEISACLEKNLKNPIYKEQDNTPLGTLLIQNAVLWDGINAIANNVDIYIVNGKIQNITAPGIRFPSTGISTIIDAQGKDVTPGLVDVHSHLAVHPWPETVAGVDDNEATNPLLPMLRIIDAINPNDEAIALVRHGGVTTSHILPGSANIMNGEAMVVKLRGSSVQEMVLTNAPRTLKWACGENPKNTYGARGQTPASRMGTGWLLRSELEKTKKLLNDQTTWCSQSNPTTPFPRQLELDGLIALLRGKAFLHNHCYTHTDFETMIRIAKEFGFKITTFHHATEAYQIADILAAENISVALFDFWGFKLESSLHSFQGAVKLHTAGVDVMIKSDHPKINSQDLLYEAQKGFYYGLPPLAALASVTSKPARALGLDGRLGSIQIGLDGDLVLWDRDPLVLGAKPWYVIIDGNIYEKNNISTSVNYPRHTDIFGNITESETTPIICPSSGPVFNLTCYAIVGVDIWTMNGTDGPLVNADLIVEDGIVTCVGFGCDWSVCGKIFRVAGGVVTAGFFEGGSHTGQAEITYSEPWTWDGTIGGSGSDGSSALVRAVDGIRPSNRLVRSNWVSGVMNVVSRPQGMQLLQGVSTAFSTCCGDIIEDFIIQEQVALHINLGNKAKADGLSASLSGQLAVLRNLFSKAKQDQNSSTSSLQPLVDALNLKIPVVVDVDSADTISAVLRLQKSFGFQLVILGGAEAHLLQNRLVTSTPPTHLLYRTRTEPNNFETHRTLDSTPVQLIQAGVKTGFIVDEVEFGRNLRWEAGRIGDLGLTLQQTLEAITTNVAEIYKLPSHYGKIVVGEKANLLLFNGDPLSILTRIQLAGIGQSVECLPKQD